MKRISSKCFVVGLLATILFYSGYAQSYKIVGTAQTNSYNNSLGNEMMSQFPEGMETLIKLDSFVNGIYFLKATTINGNHISRKFIVRK